MDFSWDESKREWVLAERGMDFPRMAFAMFDGRPLLTVPVRRDDTRRIITARRARNEEENLQTSKIYSKLEEFLSRLNEENEKIIEENINLKNILENKIILSPGKVPQAPHWHF